MGKGSIANILLVTFLLWQIATKFFSGSFFVEAIYPFVLVILVGLNLHWLIRKSTFVFGTIIFLLLLFSVSSFNILSLKYIVSTFCSFYSFIIVYLSRPYITIDNLSFTMKIVRLIIYISFIIMILTYLQVTGFGYESTDNLDQYSLGVKTRCSGIICVNVFSSFFSTSYEFVTTLFLSILLITKIELFRNIDQRFEKLSKIAGPYSINCLVITSMAFLGDSRALNVFIILAFLFPIFYKNFISFSKSKISLSNISFLLSIILFTIFLANIKIFLTMFNGISRLIISSTERIGAFSRYPSFSLIGNGYTANWLISGSEGSEYLIQGISIDLGLLGLLLLIFFISKMFLNIFNYILAKRTSFIYKYPSILASFAVVALLFKAYTDIRSIGLGILLGLFYINKNSSYGILE